MSKTIVYEIRPDVPFEATFPLSLIDALMPRINNRYLFIWETEQASKSDSHHSRESLVFRLISSLQSLLSFPENGIFAMPEVLGTIHEAPTNGHLSLKIEKTSSIHFRVSYRDDIKFSDLQPSRGFPRQHLDPDVFATGVAGVPTLKSAKAFGAQLTFLDGGFVLCVTKHHCVLDGSAMSYFVKTWVSRTRALNTGENLVQPSAQVCDAMHERSALTSTRPVQPIELDDWKVKLGAAPTVFGADTTLLPYKNIIKWIPFIKLPDITSRILHFDSSALQRLNATTEASGSGRVSTNDAISALIWRSITRARVGETPNASEQSCLCLAANGRSRIEPKLPAEFFGNAVFTIPTRLPVSGLVSLDGQSQADAARAIRASLTTKSGNRYVRSFLQLAASQRKITDLLHNINVYGGKDVMLTSWEQYFQGTSDLDLGYGRFHRMRLPDGDGFDGLVMVFPSYGLRDSSGDRSYPGGIEVMIDLEQAHMDQLLLDSELFQYVSRVI